MGLKLLGRLVLGVKGGLSPFVKTKSFYGHGLPYKPREILRRLGVEGRVLIVATIVIAGRNDWKSGCIKYIKLW